MNVEIGSFVGVLEKVQPGPHTYVKDGKIYATVRGTQAVDRVQNKVCINPDHYLPIPAPGDYCVAQVVYTSRSQAEVKVLCVEQQEMHNMSGILRSQDCNGQRLSLGDYLLCRVLTVGERAFTLTTKQAGLGVIDVEKF